MADTNGHGSAHHDGDGHGGGDGHGAGGSGESVQIIPQSSWQDMLLIAVTALVTLALVWSGFQWATGTVSLPAQAEQETPAEHAE